MCRVVVDALVCTWIVMCNMKTFISIRGLVATHLVESVTEPTRIREVMINQLPFEQTPKLSMRLAPAEYQLI